MLRGRVSVWDDRVLPTAQLCRLLRLWEWSTTRCEFFVLHFLLGWAFSNKFQSWHRSFCRSFSGLDLADSSCRSLTSPWKKMEKKGTLWSWSVHDLRIAAEKKCWERQAADTADSYGGRLPHAIAARLVWWCPTGSNCCIWEGHPSGGTLSSRGSPKK